MERPLFLLAVVALTLAVGCPGNKPAQNVGTPSARPGASSPVAWRMSKSGLGFRLSDADEEHEAAPLAKAVPLSADDTERVLARLPAMKADPDDEKDFAVREKTLPVPRAGKTVNEPFPPPASPPPQAQTKAGPLEIVRHAPVGAVEIAPHLTATFSHPMVEVTSHGDLAKGAPPISITPMPPGKWRWVGTQTVLYEPEKRFPMATDYQAEIPAGTRAASGQTLANAEKWSFSRSLTGCPSRYGLSPRGSATRLCPGRQHEGID